MRSTEKLAVMNYVHETQTAACEIPIGRRVEKVQWSFGIVHGIVFVSGARGDDPVRTARGFGGAMATRLGGIPIEYSADIEC